MKPADTPRRRVLRKSNPLWPILIVIALIWLASVVGAIDDAAEAEDQQVTATAARAAAHADEWPLILKADK